VPTAAFHRCCGLGGIEIVIRKERQPVAASREAADRFGFTQSNVLIED
jgi:hypothetical protein